jgi:hypothetical protein
MPALYAALSGRPITALVSRVRGNSDRTAGTGIPQRERRSAKQQPKVADAASELLQDVFGKNKNPCRLVYGVASLPLGTPIELEIIFEVAA